MEGKEVISPGEMVAKIKAGLDARTDPDFVFMARTDALAVNGIDDAIERANMYHEAGADLVFVEAPRTTDEMLAITSGVKAPCLANNIEGGKSPVLSAAELEKIGYAVVVFPVSATYAMARVVRDVMAEILTTGTTKGVWDRMVDFQEFAEIVDLAGLRDLEKGYALISAQTGVKKQ
jgi:methylisocitrate lyase